MAAVDKVAQMVNTAFGLGLKESERVQGAFDRVREFIPEVGSWYDEPLGRDLRRIRTRMVHYAYSKGSHSPWAVEDARTDYDGSRLLGDYAGSATKYALALRDLIPRIERVCKENAT